jgi:hypothetical protein
MDDDCCAIQPESKAKKVVACPACGGTGKTVSLATVRAMLRPDVVDELAAEHGFGFCAKSDCQTVYFGVTRSYSIRDLSQPVFQKDLRPNTPVCYCFGYSRAALQELSQRKVAVGIIREKVKAGLCACELKNPQGSCCLGNIGALSK